MPKMWAAVMMGVAGLSLVTGVAQGADGVWTNRASGNWSDTTKWVDGVVPNGAGDTATFKAASGVYTITLDTGAVTVSGLSANTESADGSAAADWSLVGGTNTLVAPALITTRGNSLSVRYTTLKSDGDVTVTGLGRFFLGDDNLLAGRLIVSNGNVRVARDSGFGPAPAALVPDAIILDNGGLENDDNNFVLTSHVNRGITVTARGGFLGCGYTGAGVQLNGPVTGPGLLGINFENGPVTLNSPANDYAGGTVVGTNGPGANPLACVLKLGQNEVLPHGAGKGGLKIGADSSYNNTLPTSTLDLNGKTETVNTLASGPRAALTSSAAGGRLSVGALGEDSDYRGTLAGGATLEKLGAGTLRLAGATLSAGTVHAKDGTVLSGGLNLAAGATLLLDGADLTLTAPSGLYEYRGASAGNAPDLGAALTYTGWQMWPAKGTTTSSAEFPNNTQFVYRGKWYVAGAGTYSFAKGFDDGGYLALDGVMVLSNGVSATRAVVNDVAVGAGWHTVEVRFAQGTGGVGPQFGFRNGILFDPQNGGFTNAAELARARMFTDDGGPDLTAYGRDNVLAARVLLAQDAALTVGAEAGTVVFAGNLTTNVAATPEPVLTVANGGAPLLFGSDSGTPAVLDAALSSAGGLTFTNRAWLRRAPAGAYSIAPGADLALDAAAPLGGPLNLTGYSVRVERGDAVGGDGSVTANAGTAVWFETMRYVNQALADSGATSAAYANNVALNTGTAQFSGAGTITYSGALTGTGNAVKSGAGDLLLTGTGSSLTGEFQLDAGRLLPASEAALGGAAINTNLDLYVRAGSVELNKTGGAADYAVRHLLGVATNLTVRLTGSNGNQIGGNVVLDGGLLDLNGHSEAIGALTNTLAGGTVTNGGATAAILTVGEGGVSSAFSGTLTDGAGAATLALAKTGSGALALPIEALRYSGGTAVDGGTLRLTVGLPVTAGLAYRLDATDTARLTFVNGTNVSAWADSTTNGYAFTQAAGAKQPVYVTNAIYGLPALRFGYGGSKRLSANKLATARTLFIVTRVGAVPQQSLAGIWGRDLADSGVRQNNATSWRHTGNGSDGNDFSHLGEMYIDGAYGSSFAANPLHVLSAVSTTDKVWTNAVGDYWGNATYNRYFKGDVGEILVYNRVLSTNERQRVETYLKAKWYGGASLPAERPLTVAPGATLAVQAFNGLTLQTLAGGGTLAPEGGSTVTVTGYGSFTGAVAGAGTVAVRDATGADVPFVPQSFGVTVVNNGTQDKVLRVGTQVANVFLGSVQDGSNALGIVHSGPGVTFFAGTNSTYTGETTVENGAAIMSGAVSTKYVRFSPLLTRTTGAYTGTGYQLSEFQLLLSGAPVAYPVGTSATSEGKAAGPEGPEKAIDGLTGTKFYTDLKNPLRPLVLALPESVVFDAYRWYTANDAEGRDPVAWTVETSADGVNWTALDAQDYSANQAAITTARYTLAGAWTLSDVAAMNVFSDVSATTVSAPGTLGVSGTSETVGALSGDGALVLLNGGTLGINAFTDAAFSGGITGTGTLVKAGAQTQSLSGALAFSGEIVVDAGVLDLGGAVLTGVTNIVLRAGGELTGSAAVNGSLTVTFEGGVFSGSLAVTGALTTSGTVRLAVPEGTAYPYARTCFSYASADAATLSALTNAVKPAPLPAGHTATLRVTGTSARLIIAPGGTVICIR